MHSTIVVSLLLAATSNALPTAKPQLLGALAGGIADAVDGIADRLDRDRPHRECRDLRNSRDFRDCQEYYDNRDGGRGYGYRGWHTDDGETAPDATPKDSNKVAKRSPQIISGLVGGIADTIDGVVDGIAGGLDFSDWRDSDWSNYRDWLESRPWYHRTVANNAAAKDSSQVSKRNAQIVGPILEAVGDGIQDIKDGIFGSGSVEDDWEDFVPEGDFLDKRNIAAAKSRVSKRSPQLFELLEGIQEALAKLYEGYGRKGSDDDSNGYKDSESWGLPAPAMPDYLPAPPAAPMPLNELGPVDSTTIIE
jgi:hypothetical protein